MEKKLIYSGKAKNVHQLSKNTVILEFRDDATAGNKAKHDVIQGKGELNCSISSMMFEYLHDNFYSLTHYIDKISSNTQLCYAVDIIPIEVIVRNKSAGTFCKRYGIEKGKKFEDPIVEFCLKNDDLNDPIITHDVIIQLDIASFAELASMKSNALDINDKLITLFKKIKLDLIDFKLEFGLRKKDNVLVLSDEICPDTMRLWDEQGNSFDKDLFRENTGDLLEGYKRVETLLRNEIGC